MHHVFSVCRYTLPFLLVTFVTSTICCGQQLERASKKQRLVQNKNQENENGQKAEDASAEEKRKQRLLDRQQKEIKQLEAYLKSRDIKSSFEGVREYFRELTDSKRDWSAEKDLIAQLGSASYSKRVLAQEKLLKLPQVPLEMLKDATQSNDREQAFRAKIILENAIPRRSETVLKVLRFVQIKKQSGHCEDIFKVLKIFEDQTSILRQAKSTIGDTANESDVELLASQLDSGDNKAFQDIAMYSLRLKESKALADKFGKWSTASQLSESLRLEAMLGLADLGDRRSLNLLLAMMESGKEASSRSRSYVALKKLTGQKEMKFSAYEKKEDVRAKQLGVWKEWLEKNGESVALQFPLRSVRLGKSHLNGHTLIAYGYKNKVVEFDEEMNEVWSYACKAPWSAEKMENGNYLIAEYQKQRVIEVSPEKNVVRTWSVTGPLNARPLDNGNVLISSYSQRKVLEMTPDGKTVWEHKAKNLVPDAVRLESGNTLISEYNRVVEVNKGGEVVWEVNSANVSGMNQVMGVQAGDDDTILIACMSGFVAEISRDKKVVWRRKCSRPSDVFRTEEGNTLITEGSQYIEVTKDGEVVWKKSGGNYGTIRR